MNRSPGTRQQITPIASGGRNRSGPRSFSVPAVIAIWLLLSSAMAVASSHDWPMWRYNAARGGETPQALPDKLHLLWERHFAELKPAYRTKRIQFDAGYEPVVLGKTIFVASSRNDSLTALDTETGKEKWRFYTDGPVRLAPVAWNDRVFFGSDDGHLYCLAVADGRLLWKFRGVPSERKLLGNGRLISVWPVRGGPVLDNGRIYFAAGVWPFEGVFLYSLDAETGEVIWLNDDSGYLYGPQPHGAESLGGITPQGYLVVVGNQLIVPCGQAMPARFDLQTGKLLFFELPKPGRLPGGWFASADVRRGEVLLDAVVNRDLHEDKVYQGPGKPNVQSTIRAGEEVYRFNDGLPGVEGRIHSMLAADDKLFVVTLDGKLYCFSPQKPTTPARYPLKLQTPRAQPRYKPAFGKQVIDTIDNRHGYALVLGIPDSGLLDTLITRTEFHVIGVDTDAAKIDALRRQFDDAGLYGDRISLHTAKPGEIEFPPYMASLAVVNNCQWLSNGDVAQIEASDLDLLRPHGGTACLKLSDAAHARLAVANKLEDSMTVERTEKMTVVRRHGALPGSVNYTGGWSSPDERVKAPLGVLWFDDALAHFKRSPQPMFVDGLMISYSKDWMARHREGKKTPYALLSRVISDVYTGRVLAADEPHAAGTNLPSRDREVSQPVQYRPPYQSDDWKPEKPAAGDRINPLTGNKEPRTFPKSYGCDGGVDYGHLYAMRSGTAAFYDKRLESGTCYISGTRSGCTNSVIPACGLLNVPYFFDGCTCSYPLPSGLALVSMPPEYEQWAAWGPGKATDIRRVGVNFGAPGDRMTEAGTLWLDYPSRGGPSPQLDIEVQPPQAQFHYRHSLWIEGGTGWPWVAASGVQGASEITISGLKSATFTVRLCFADPEHHKPGQRQFDIAINGRAVAETFDIAQAAGGRMRTTVLEYENIKIDDSLRIDLKPRRGKPILSGIEIVALGL
jgi:outer membrane protein assembly factor BamB